ncbi:MAG: uroporphyrinogen-III synthase [Paracoccaceae bacterium]
MSGTQARLLLLRPRVQSHRFAAQVQARFGDRVRIVEAPLQEIRFLPVSLPSPLPDALILTSENGVTAATGIAGLAGTAVWCVGARTAALAQKAGFSLLGHFLTADDLASGLVKDRGNLPAASFLHVRGTHARGDIARRLSAAGLTCAEIVAYDQGDLPPAPALLETLAQDGLTIVMLFSPRSARLFAAAIGELQPAVAVIALSKAVAEAYDGPAPLGMRIASAPTGEAMLDAVTMELDTGARG